MISGAGSRGRVSRRVQIPPLPTSSRAKTQITHTDITLSESQRRERRHSGGTPPTRGAQMTVSLHCQMPGSGRWVRTGRGKREAPGPPGMSEVWTWMGTRPFYVEMKIAPAVRLGLVHVSVLRYTSKKRVNKLYCVMPQKKSLSTKPCLHHPGLSLFLHLQNGGSGGTCLPVHRV